MRRANLKGRIGLKTITNIALKTNNQEIRQDKEILLHKKLENKVIKKKERVISAKAQFKKKKVFIHI